MCFSACALNGELIDLIDKYKNFETMTTTMLNEFVEKILVVHERYRKGSQEGSPPIRGYGWLRAYMPLPEVYQGRNPCRHYLKETGVAFTLLQFHQFILSC
ncbi:DUF4368 domain-containing protein [Clostridioides sp. ES-S-0190-01]|uniref:DUF4368 domain-containing protein n=1 Tax=unclassified Clostridioides TaxID=2635829 RepID=UPI0039BD929C